MTRVLSAAVLVAVLVSVVWFAPPWATLALGVLVAAVAGLELHRLSGAARGSWPPLIAAVAAALVTAGFAFGDPLVAGLTHFTMLVTALLAAVLLGGLATLASGRPAPDAVPSVALVFMAPLYVGLPLGVLVWVQVVYGREALLLPVVIVALSDTAQYYVGRAIGRRRLAPQVSPAKTVEGALGGLVAATILGAALAPAWLAVAVTPMAPVSRLVGAALGALLALAGMAGDLFESFLKRSAGVKDSAALIPGHGGVLDRIDAHLLAAPVYYLFLRYLL
jgi:phosphatidate cytidylyltransferase